MMSAPLFLAILFSAITLWRPSRPAEVNVYEGSSHEKIRNKLRYLVRELVLDAEMKLKAIQKYRSVHYKTKPYQLGDIVSKLRNHFKLMVKNYQIAHRNLSYNHLHHYENLKIFVEVSRLNNDLEIHVNMALEWLVKRARAEDIHRYMKQTLRNGAGRNYEESEQMLRAVVARGRNALLRRGRGARARGGANRKNKKWRYARGYEFV